jgi:flagellar assembly factor FliW
LSFLPVCGLPETRQICPGVPLAWAFFTHSARHSAPNCHFIGPKRGGMSFAKEIVHYNKINGMNTLELMEPGKPATTSANRAKEVVVLPYGLLGFEHVKNYTLLTKADEAPFLWFQMLQDPKHAFLVLPPGVAIPDYQPDLDDQDVEFLELNDPSDAFILNIVTLRGAGKATVNLKGPVVINRRTWIGKQVIPTNAVQYPTRHPLALS